MRSISKNRLICDVMNQTEDQWKNKEGEMDDVKIFSHQAVQEDYGKPQSRRLGVGLGEHCRSPSSTEASSNLFERAKPK